MSTFPGQFPITPFGMVMFGQDFAEKEKSVLFMEQLLRIISNYFKFVIFELLAPFTHSRFLATVPLRFATICKIVVYRGVLWSFVVEPW